MLEKHFLKPKRESMGSTMQFLTLPILEQGLGVTWDWNGFSKGTRTQGLMWWPSFYGGSCHRMWRIKSPGFTHLQSKILELLPVKPIIYFYFDFFPRTQFPLLRDSIRLAAGNLGIDPKNGSLYILKCKGSTCFFLLQNWLLVEKVIALEKFHINFDFFNFWISLGQ